MVIARPFNHTGPGQRDIFIVSSLARQAAEARLAGASSLRVVTGNPDTRRDFTDVRDVVRAYRLLAASAPGGGRRGVQRQHRALDLGRRAGGADRRAARRGSRWSTSSIPRACARTR